MAGIQGLDELEDFADSLKEVSGEGRSDGIHKARRDAMRETAKRFKKILVEQIRATETMKGGTLDSRTSPYSPGGENESSGSNMHISDVGSWNHEILGDDMAVIYPSPEIWRRASWLEEGTDDHGPRGDKPMYFEVNGTTIVVADVPEGTSPSGVDALDGPEMEDYLFEHGVPGEVSGVEPQNFFKRAVRVAKGLNIFEEEMEKQLNQTFEEAGLEVTGDW